MSNTKSILENIKKKISSLESEKPSQKEYMQEKPADPNLDDVGGDDFEYIDSNESDVMLENEIENSFSDEEDDFELSEELVSEEEPQGEVEEENDDIFDESFEDFSENSKKLQQDNFSEEGEEDLEENLSPEDDLQESYSDFNHEDDELDFEELHLDEEDHKENQEDDDLDLEISEEDSDDLTSENLQGLAQNNSEFSMEEDDDIFGGQNLEEIYKKELNKTKEMNGGTNFENKEFEEMPIGNDLDHEEDGIFGTSSEEPLFDEDDHDEEEEGDDHLDLLEEDHEEEHFDAEDSHHEDDFMQEEAFDHSKNLINEETASKISNSFDELKSAQISSKIADSLTQDQIKEIAIKEISPKLQDWINENLHELVEKIIREEIARITKK